MSLAYFEYLENADLINKEVEIYQSITAEEIKKWLQNCWTPMPMSSSLPSIGQNPA